MAFLTNEQMINKLLESVYEDIFEPNVFELIANSHDMAHLEVHPDNNGSAAFVYMDDDKHYSSILRDGTIMGHRETVKYFDCFDDSDYEMPAELKGYLNKVCEYSSCGFIPSYYDFEHTYSDSEYAYKDSPIIFNFFHCMEEVADSLLNEDIEFAEQIIETFAKHQFGSNEKHLFTELMSNLDSVLGEYRKEL